MPNYSFKNKTTDEITVQFMKISELDEYLKNNPHLESIITHAPGIQDPIRIGVTKPKQEFRERLKEIKKKQQSS